MKRVVWNRRYDGPVDRIDFKKLKVGQRIYFEVIEYDRGCVPVVLEATITGLRQRGYVRKASVKVYDEKIGVMYVHTGHILRILKQE